MSELLPQLENLTPEQQALLRLRLQQIKQQAQRPAPLHELFAGQARRNPDRVAVTYGDSQVSYGVLDRLSNRLAGLLRDRGVGRESLVGLCVPRSIEMVVGLLAIVKAGAAYVPLDPAYPQDRLAYMVEDAGLGVVLAGRAAVGVLPETDAPVLVVEDLWSELDAWPDTDPASDVTCDDLAYVIYTSGSTGRPKGVQVTHRGIRGIARWQNENYGLDTPTRVLQGTSLSFDISVWELSAALLSGGTLVLPPPDLQMIGTDLADFLTEQAVENINLTPAALSTLPVESLPFLKCVSVGGEACPRELVRTWSEDRLFFNGYGPSEATIAVSVARYTPDLERVHIGRPIDGAQMYVLDSRLQLQPVGVAGELYLGGAGLARGYLGRPELTAEAFVANPFGEAGSRLYRTGDLARFLPDGNVEFLGRVDDQVKIRGFRVELGEIEDALTQHPDVTSAAVLVHQEGATKRLVAFVVGREAVPGEVLRSFLAERLPHYMVPGVFVPLDVLPLSPNGKVDRAVLAGLPWEEHAAGEREFVAPRTEVEEKLALVWGEVLGTGQPVGVHDNFFSLGGDSILSLQVIFRAKQLGLYFTVKQLFEFQSIAELAPVVESRDAARVEAEQGLVTGRVELTPIQRWFFAQEFAVPAHFNQSVLVEVEAGLSSDQWRRVVRRVLEQHDGLRARFFREDGDWCSELTGMPEEVPWQVEDLSACAAGEREARLLEVARAVQAGMDLSRGPLFRAVLFTGLDDDQTAPRLLLVAHHLVVDAVSWRVILEDLDVLTGQVRRGQEQALPEKSSSWRQWAARLAEEAGSETTAAELPFWEKQSVPSARDLPLDGSGDGNTIGGSRVFEAVLGAEETRALLRDVPSVFGTRINDVLLTGVASAVGAWTGDGRVRVDVEGHGREDLFEDTDVSRTTGWFTTISPLDLPVPASGGLADGLKEIKELLRARPRQGIGHGLLAHGPSGSATGIDPTTTAQISFNYLGQFDGSFAGGFADSMGMAGSDTAGDNRRPYLIDIVSHVRDGRLHMEWTYSGTAHQEETIRRVAERTLDVLAALADETRRPDVQGYTPSDLELSGLDQEQINELVGDLRAHPAWRASGLPRPLEDCCPQTPVQQGMWFQSQYARGEGFYHVQNVFRIEQELDVEAFRESWAQVMRRHPILRTGFWTTKDNQALQLVWADLPVPLEVVDWRSESDDGRRKRLDAHLLEDRTRGFQPEDAPQWRMLLARTADDRYELVWSAHHTILDGWSISLVLADAIQWYGALVEGRHLEQAPTPPYRDYVAWLQEQDLQEAEDYWRDTLQDVEEATLLNLGTRPEADSNAPGEPAPYLWAEDFLDEAETAELQSFALRHRLTLNTVLQGCWALLLGRYARTDDVVFGTVASGRPAEIEGVERMVGLFINTLPLRVRMPEQSSVLAWLQELQEQSLRMRQYEHSPLSEVQRWSGLPAGAPLFETLFVFENYPEGDGDGETALRLEALGSKEQTHYPLNTAITVGERIGINILYDTRRFDGRSVEAMLAHLKQICRELVTQPQQSLAQVSLLTDAELTRALEQWSSESTSPVEDVLLHELLAEQVRRTPDSVAVVHEDGHLTYAELDARANQLAHWLRGRGVGPDVLVGLCMDRSLEGIVGLLGILKAGGAYVPIDPRYPLDRMRYVVEDSRLRLILTQRHLLPRLPELPDGDLTTLCLDSDWSAVAAGPRTAPSTAVTSRNLAYIIYTSGSTGLPKGVMVAHRNLQHVVPWIRHNPCFDRRQNVLQVASTSFDFSVWEIVLPLVTGGTLHIPAPHTRMIGTDLQKMLSERAIESLNFTPGALATLPTDDPLPQLRTLVVGGEAYSADLIRTWAPGRTFFNVYGPTETTIFATGTHTDENLDLIHIGRPITNARFYVLDPYLRPVPPGVPGELWIGGAGVTRGYMNRPDLTAEYFVADPFGDEPGGRLYRSGDLVRYLPDGNIEFIERIDGQVKIRGFRIELGEIEAVLEQHPLVRNCAVLAQPDGTGKRLVGYVVPASEGALDADDVTAIEQTLRAHLKEQLPAYMVPSAFVTLDELPLTGNGKLNRRALPLPDESATPARTEASLPRTATEAKLADIWSEVLGHSPIGVLDDFFSLGGHSLLAVKVAARVQQAFGVELPVRVLFEQPALAQVAAELDRLLLEQQPYPALDLVPVTRDEPVPATFDQQRLWYMDRLVPDSPLYTVGWLLHRPEATDPARLGRALEALIARHEVLRTTFRENGGRVWQDIAPAGTVVLTEADLSAEPPQRRVESVQAVARELWLETFDLTRGPLFRTLLIHLPEGESLLVFSAHHAVFDGYSVGILNEELLRLYDLLADADATLPEPPAVQFADYAVWQQQWLEEERLRPHLEYWKEQLADAPALISLPTDHPRPAVQNYRGANLTSALPAELLEQLRKVSVEHQTTDFVTFLSAFAVLLSRYSGQDKVVIGIPVAGRGRIETEPMIGFLVNTIALCVDLEGDPDFADVLHQVRWKLLEAQSRQEVPFDRIVEELKPERSLSYSPVFQVMFTGLDKLFEELPETRQPAWIHDVTDDGVGVAKFDLGMSIQQRDGELRFTFEYSTDLFERDTVAGMQEHLRNLLAAAVAAPRTSVARLPLLADEARGRILRERNATEDPGALRPVALHELFAEQVRRSPDRVALSYEDQQLTYAGLDRRADRLARTLRDLGVGPESRVGVCMRRSLDLVTALLAVLKAGGAYVPLDPDYPQERLAFMAEDAEVRLVLTQPGTRDSVGFLSDGSDGGVRLLELEEDEASWPEASSEPLDVTVNPDGLAYVIYTSGSTGRPKGAMLSHRGICNRLLWMQDAYGIGEDDRVLQKTPYSFDVSVWEFFWPLITGAQLHVARPEGHRDPAYLADLIERQGIGVLHFVPSMLQAFLQQPTVGHQCRGVRHVMCSGEALPPEVRDEFLRTLPGTRLHNLYGPTEASVDVSFWECEDVPGATTVPIGRPVANTRLYVLDEAMEPVPDGVIGELFIGGVQLARGYLGRPDLTAERFVADPFGDGRLYATGDLARYRADGAIEYAGRKDHQVKIRGYRIEIEEIEAVLADHPAVRSCLVVVHEVTSADKRLTAFVTWQDGQEPGPDALRASLLERLPEYMVPTYFVVLDEFPLTANGKVDRKALPALSDIVRQTQADDEHVAPTTETEQVLADLWARLLDLDRVGIRDDFFALGGHSLLVASMATEVQDRWGITLMLTSVFQNRTVEALAQVIDQSVDEGDSEEEDAAELFDLL
ncbi:amino acid adenylation domain-containing protein [Streptomyces sp. GD-15H]|uniref:amino acid adenylation domain-containing protein n=1 Tax=Streptomyces sp. GD-15H TaxID=3129112 RepID=UPI00324329B0